jgi:uncharacterized membrane protein
MFNKTTSIYEIKFANHVVINNILSQNELVVYLTTSLSSLSRIINDCRTMMASYSFQFFILNVKIMNLYFIFSLSLLFSVYNVNSNVICHKMVLFDQ